MQKQQPAQQIKPKRDKKKNTQTGGMPMGQNINIFSQLSATYLTNKSVTTQQEQHFVKETQIIQFHDQNVNRLISLLRKKAEVTKVKAVVQLKQAIKQMTQNDMEQFIPTFANLYQEIVINEQSKQVYQEFVEIASWIVEKYKKVALREISTLYPVMLISMKLTKVGKLLFTGTEQEISQKIYLLFVKKQVKKKFLLLSKLLLQNQQLHVVSQSNYQRNVYQYVKMIKEILSIYVGHSKINDLRDETILIVRDICQLLSGKTIDQYLKVGGRGKASLLEIYTFFVKFSTLEKLSEVNWKKFAKIVCQHFLDKDPVVQTTLWKYCNKDLLISLKSIARQQQKQDEYLIFNELLPKPQDKLIDCLPLGGLSMYKAFPSYIKQHQSFVITLNDSHKSIVQKLTYQRKFLQSILSQEDENEARIDCYYLVAEHMIQNCIELQSGKLEKIIVQKQGEKLQDSKKAKQIKTLMDKLRTQTVANLQKRYYTDPPMSKNYLTFHLPEYFTKLLNNYQFPSFTPNFNQKFTFTLYKNLKTDSSFLQAIYTKCESNLSLLLNFYQTWTQTDKQVNLDMTEENDQYQKTAKIFLLSNKKRVLNQSYWFLKSWDLRKSAIIYDPRLTAKDLQNQNAQQAQHGVNIHFTPINKHLQQIYCVPELNKERFEFFMSLLQDPQIQTGNIKFFLPYLFTHLIDEDNIEVLMQKYMHKVNDLNQGKWIVGEREITFLRVIVQCFNIYLLRQERDVSEKILIKFKPFFLSIGSFLRTLNTYKMDSVVMEILKELNQLLRVRQYEELLLEALQFLLKSVYSMIISKSSPQQEKHRKNRLKRINEFIEHCIWYMVRKGSANYSLLLIELFREQKLWQHAQTQIEPWAIGYNILSLCDSQTIDETVKEMILGFNVHYRMVSLLIASQLILPLQVYPEFKRTFLQMRHFLLKEYTKLLSIQEQMFNLQQLVIYQYEQQKLTQAQGLKTLIKNIVKNHHQFTPSQISTLAKDIVQLLIQRLLEEKQDNQESIQIEEGAIVNKGHHEINKERLNIRTIIVTIILGEMPLEDISKEIQTSYYRVLEMLQKETKNLESHFQKFLSICLLSTTLWRTTIGEETIANWESLQLTKQLLTQLIPQINDIQPLTNYHSFVIFSTINSLYPILGYGMISSNIDEIMTLFWLNKNRQNELYIFEQQEKIKLVNRIYLEIPKPIAYQIINQLPHQALTEYGYYQKFLLQLQDQQQEFDNNQQSTQALQQQQKSIHNLFIEYSQLLMKIATFISLGNTQQVPQQHTLISLLQCPFAGIKKTVFLLLKQLYEYKLVKPTIPEIFQQFLTYKLNPQHQLQSIKVVNQIYNFLYTWLTLISRKKAIEVVQTEQHEQEQLTLQDYIQSTGVSQILLSNLFLLIADKLDYLKDQTSYPLTSEELLMEDFTLNVDQEHHLEQKLFQLSAKVLFYYSINFPLFLRTFMDKSKKYKTVCEKLLRNYISDAIFAKEVAMIQLRQPEWKANNNLQIYVVKKNKQIYAEYQHDVIRIGLRLVMRPNYPLTPIFIEFGQGLKMEDGTKWALMLQSQLHNKNNSIINGIILWKQNIDKKLSGIQECAICYDIVDPKGHLPKKACKTCKKKFHSNCIMKWFSKSNKSECPLCKSQFL